MVTPIYQMQNVLNVYARQLNNKRQAATDKQYNIEKIVDRINLSEAGQEKAIIKKITCSIVKKIFNHNRSQNHEFNKTPQPQKELNTNGSIKNNGDSILAFHTIDANNTKYLESFEMTESDPPVKDL